MMPPALLKFLQQASRGVSKEPLKASVAPSDISWQVSSGTHRSVFCKNLARLRQFLLILEGGTFFFGLSKILLVEVPWNWTLISKRPLVDSQKI